MTDPSPSFWEGRRVLLTGHTGFKGSWMSHWLTSMGASVHGVSLPQPVSSPALWETLGLDAVRDRRADIVSDEWQQEVQRFDPSIVFHLAAQPLVAVGYREPAATFRTNVQGTVKVLEALGAMTSVEACVVITTDKVYDVRRPPPFKEDSPLGGKDPYSASKAAAELVVTSWPTSSPTATARAGNVIGGGDWAVDRLLPDLLRAWRSGREVVLRMPSAVRPWQHVVEPLAGYLLYAEALATRASMPLAMNFGPDESQQVAVADVVEFAAAAWHERQSGTRPRWRVEKRSDMPETALLTLDSTRAAEALGWEGRWDWQGAVSRTLAWYLAEQEGAEPAELVAADIDAYLETTSPS